MRNVQLKNKKDIIVNNIKGWHIVNNLPIKEASWEDILSQSLDNDEQQRCIWDKNKHCSGKDLQFLKDNVSCKTGKINKKILSISSYRLTTCKNIDELKNEIDRRGASFDYYYILCRIEYKDKYVYSMYSIPEDFLCTDNFINWKELYPKSKKGRTNYSAESKNGDMKLTITESMSNQLWFKINIDVISKYKIFECETDILPKIRYSELYEWYKKDSKRIQK